MEKNTSATFATYSPAAFKTFAGALMAFFSNECPQIGGERTRKVLVDSIINLVSKFYPETTHLKQGQTMWTSVHKDAKGSYGKTIQNTELVPVALTLVKETDAMDRANGKKLSEIKKEASVRLCQEAYKQNGCLSLVDLSLLLKISPATASKYLRRYEEENKTVVPRRGTIHDMGPTLTHKKIIIEKLFIQQKTVQQVMREEEHSSKAIERYITTFKRVLFCYQKGMNRSETAYSLTITENLVQEYLDIIDIYKERKYILDKIVNFEVNEETAIDRIAASMNS